MVRGCFDSDARRYGQAYITGDCDARSQLQVILLGPMQIVSSLQAALLDNESIAFDRLQHISDECRTNVSVVLGTLSQRLAASHNVVKDRIDSPPTCMSGSSYNSAGLSHSTSNSTYSSARTSGAPSISQALLDGDKHSVSLQRPMLPSHESSGTQCRATQLQRNDTGQSYHDSIEDWAGAARVQAERDPDDLSLRRPSSHTLGPDDAALFSFPNSPKSREPSPPLQHPDVGTQASSPGVEPSRTGSQAELTDTIGRSRTQPDVSSQSLTSYRHRIKRGDHITLSSSSLTTTTGARAATAPLHLLTQTDQGSRTLTSLTTSPVDVNDDRIHHTAPGALPGLGLQVKNHKTAPGLTYPPTHIDGMRVPIPPRGDTATIARSDSMAQASHGAKGDRLRARLRLSQRQQAPAYIDLQQPGPPPQGPVPPTPVQRRPPSGSVRTDSPGSPEVLERLSRVRVTPVGEEVRRGPLLNRSPSTAPILVTRVLPPLTAVALSLPDERNASPFCKMAVRLFTHPRDLYPHASTAFVKARRPVGLNNMILYWQCDACSFEGPMAYRDGPLDKKGRAGKKEKIFDDSVRDGVQTSIPGGAGGGIGIRYRWAFLAKCHVELKQVPEGTRDGSYGAFGCLFCAAEGTARGWTGMEGDTISVRSGMSQERSRHGVPVFGNLQSFMNHLQIHRRQRYWPGKEMQERMKCRVGRTAVDEKEFDIILLPVEADDGS